jgi:hypothetical protein
MGIPIQDKLKLHNQISAMQIGRYWRNYVLVKPEKIMSLYAILNVMDHFIYYSQSLKNSNWNLL